MKHSILILAMMAVATSVQAAPDSAVLQTEAQRIAVMNQAKDCVLAVFSANGQGGGSGVVISPDGFALTNFHVVEPCGRAMQCGMADGKVYDAVVVGIDPTGDVALIQLFGRDDFPCASIGNSDEMRAGDWVFAMGNPFLLATDLQPTVTWGIVSGTHRYQPPAGTLLEYTDCLQTDASINPGNSGGPLFNDRGQLIGINGRASFEKRGRVNVGAAYAISINQIVNFLGVLHSGRIVDHATLGARVASDADGRVVVSDILEDSDAYRRGLRIDDELVCFADRPISTPNGFKNILGIFPKGWRVPLSYRRDGQRYDTLVRLAGLHTTGELAEAVSGQRQVEPMPLPKPKDTPEGEQAEKPKENTPPKPQGPPPADPFAEETLPIPEIVQQHFTERRGYANYYYNTLNRQRVWDAWCLKANPTNLKGRWTIAGQPERGGEFQFEVTNDAAVLKLPSHEIRWEADGPFSTSLLPDGSGGLLPTLWMLRRLSVEGLDRFGEVYYEGTAPLVNHPGLADVLLASHKGMECRIYFDPKEGNLLAVEMFPDEYTDPCEIYFSEFRMEAGRSVPGRMEVRYGDETYAIFFIKDFSVANQ